MTRDPCPPHRLLLLLFVSVFLVFTGCGGGGGGSSSGAGVANGTIGGSVFGIVGGSPGLTPLGGVRVVATRTNNGLPLTRTAFTDQGGSYRVFDVPLGTWDLSYQLNGFSSGSGTGSPIRTFVSSNGLASVQDVVLNQTGAVGSGNVVIFLVDGATGSPVIGASVTVGGFPPTFTSFDGSYTFDVPAVGGPQAITVFHPGLAGSIPFPATVTPVAGFPVVLTVSLDAAVSFVTGTIQSGAFNGLYSAAGVLGTVSITSPQVSQVFLAPLIDPGTGQFSVQVPSSSASGTQFLDLVFTSPFLQQVQVNGILSPTPGATAALSSAVVMQPFTSTVQGNVVNSFGSAPTGIPNQVVIVETGQAATPIGGSYSFFGVPSGLPLTLQATTLIAPAGVETGAQLITPLPGVFSAPLILTN